MTDLSPLDPTRQAHSSTGVLHRVIERRYPKPDYQQHAGDTVCGCIVDNGGNWCWCDGYDTERLGLRRCVFCYGGS